MSKTTPSSDTGLTKNPPSVNDLNSEPTVKIVKIDDIRLWERNYRRGDVRAIRRSIQRFGFNGALRVWRGTVVAGNHTLKALQQMKKEGESPPFGVTKDWAVAVIDISRLSEREAEAFAIADNKTQELGEIDKGALAELLSDLRASEDGDLAVETGYGTDDLLRLLGAVEDSPAPVEEQLADMRSRPTSLKTGQIWKLGNHVLAIGDSTDPGIVGRLLQHGAPVLMVTDPPYGVNYDPEWRSNAGLQGPTDRGVVTNDSLSDWREAYKLFPGDVAYVWHASGPPQISVHESLVAVGLEPRQQIIWAKNVAPISRAHYHSQHEPCWYCVRKGRTANWHGDRAQTTVWSIPKPNRQDSGHATQKPVECMLRPILNHTEVGDFVYDPFCGSGTTIIAAEQSMRHCLAIEIEPAYAQIIVDRWMAETGGTPELLE